MVRETNRWVSWGPSWERKWEDVVKGEVGEEGEGGEGAIMCQPPASISSFITSDQMRLLGAIALCHCVRATDQLMRM